jgi:CMP-N,N'-diacetyllegionaminic acid synthase
MIGRNTVISIIPARGGSKRLPKKNILKLNGVPLITYSIQAALGCPLVDKVVVSTDSNEIADVAIQAGAEIDIRSGELSTDAATTIDVLKDLLIRMDPYDICVTLQPTSPLRTADDVTKSIELFDQMNADAVISVCKAEHPPHWINTIGSNGEMSDFLREEIKTSRSQDLGTYYRLNGAIYCNSVQRLLASNSPIFESNCYAYVMPLNRSVDIDTFDDFELASFYISKKNSGHK